MQFCEWFQQIVNEDEEFVTKIVWSDEAQFKLNGTVNRHNCVYWAPENLHIHVGKAVNLPAVIVWCGLSATGLIGPFFFEGAVTGEAYLEMLRSSILPAILALYENSEVFYQQDGAPPHYHRDLWAFVNENLQGHRIGRRGTCDLGDLRAEIRAACASVPINTLTVFVQSNARRCNRCLAANGNHFEYLH